MSTSPSPEFDHFFYVAFKEISSLQNTSNNVDSSKKIKFLFLVLYVSERDDTGGDARC